MKPPVSNCCKGPKSDTETDFAIKSEQMDWRENTTIIKIGNKTYLVSPEDGKPNDVEEVLSSAMDEAITTAVKEATEREKINTGKIKKRQYEQGVMHERKRIVEELKKIEAEKWDDAEHCSCLRYAIEVIQPK